MTLLSSSTWNTFLDCARSLLLGEVLRIAPPYSYGRDSLFGISSHIHDHHKDGKIQAFDPFEMAYLELALHFFFLYHGCLEGTHEISLHLILQDTLAIGSTLS